MADNPNDTNLTVRQARLYVPPFDELASVLENGLRPNYKHVEVSLVPCPDLTQAPFNLAAPGLCGSPRLAEVGGVPNLLPKPDTRKIYDLDAVAALCDLPDAFVLGAGAGPHHHVGVNCEGVINARTGARPLNQSYIASVEPTNGLHKIEPAPNTDFSLMANLNLCDGRSDGQVLEVIARCRTGPVSSFMQCVRESLAARYAPQGRAVGLGGVFLVEKGRARLHVMPAFSEQPLHSLQQVNSWLRFYEMSAPLVCVGHLVSGDPLTGGVAEGGEMDLRLEHFHCFSDHGEGGHYHYDTTPEDVWYRAYFSVAERMFRVDQPPAPHNFTQ